MQYSAKIESETQIRKQKICFLQNIMSYQQACFFPTIATDYFQSVSQLKNTYFKCTYCNNMRFSENNFILTPFLNKYQISDCNKTSTIVLLLTTILKISQHDVS